MYLAEINIGHYAVDWGTVSAWVAAIGTTLAFTATALVIRRDAKSRRFSQISKVAFYNPDPPKGAIGYSAKWDRIENMSDEPIYDVSIGYSNRFHSIIEMERDIILPRGKLDAINLNYGTSYAFIRDNSGILWHRKLDGSVTEVGLWGNTKVRRQKKRQERERAKVAKQSAVSGGVVDPLSEPDAGAALPTTLPQQDPPAADALGDTDPSRRDT